MNFKSEYLWWLKLFGEDIVGPFSFKYNKIEWRYFHQFYAIHFGGGVTWSFCVDDYNEIFWKKTESIFNASHTWNMLRNYGISSQNSKLFFVWGIFITWNMKGGLISEFFNLVQSSKKVCHLETFFNDGKTYWDFFCFFFQQ